jgi:hypothetical protein
MRPKPTFNVTNFQDVINVQMNDSMRQLLIELIDEFETNELEAECMAFRNALNNPQGDRFKRIKPHAGRRKFQHAHEDD